MTRPHPPSLPSSEEPPAPDLDAVARGEPGAVDAWFRREHPEVYRLCLGFLADPAEAEDVAQDAMLHLLDHMDERDPGRPWRAWRNTLVLNRCRDRLRRAAARGRAEHAAAEAALPDRLPDPVVAAESGEVRAVLTAALGSLSPREREAFVLRDLEGVSTAEAARALGVGESTVRSLLTLARRRLRNLLGERLPGLAGGEIHG